MQKLYFVVFFCFCCFILCPETVLATRDQWSVSLFYGQLTKIHFEKIFYNEPSLENRHILGISVRRELFQLKEKLCFVPRGFYVDAEGLIAHKWGAWKGYEQQYQDVATSLNLRYEFDQESWLPINNFSFGNGFSWITQSSEYEEELTLNNKKSRLLYYLMVDMGLEIPYIENWEGVLRVHHRSGFYGLINQVQGGSNYMTYGLRYYF